MLAKLGYFLLVLENIGQKHPQTILIWRRIVYFRCNCTAKGHAPIFDPSVKPNTIVRLWQKLIITFFIIYLSLIIMKFKRFFLALPIAAIAVLFTFCAKEPLPTTEVAVPQTTEERGACTVKIQAVNCSIDLCGVQTNLNFCTDPTQFGTAFLANGAAGVYNLITPATVTATINTGFPTSVFPSVIVTSKAGTTTYPLNPLTPGVPAVINIGNTCNLF